MRLSGDTHGANGVGLSATGRRHAARAAPETGATSDEEHDVLGLHTRTESAPRPQKQEFLPRILKGRLHAAIGYTEPEAGTDLAALRTRAVRDGDSYFINGNKVFTSLANYADYIWLAARTDPDAPKHSGISIFLVDTRLPGYK